MPVTLKRGVEVPESLENHEILVTDLTEPVPVIEVQPKGSIDIPKVFEGDFIAEVTSIILVCALIYVLFRMVVILMPLIISLVFVGGVGYLGYLML